MEETAEETATAQRAVTVAAAATTSAGAAREGLVAAVGRARFSDGRTPDHPMNAVISGNHLHDWGVWGKQTSAYFGGMVKDTHLTHNLIYNGPRAGINQNDGFAGGSEFAYNLLFNTVLDTGDHG